MASKQTEYHRRWLAGLSDEQKAEQRAKNAARARAKKAAETPEARAVRLEKTRANARRRMETDPERARAIIRVSHEKNIERVRAYRKAKIAKNKDIVTAAKRGVPCERCGFVFPTECMDFHHRDPAGKVGDVGRGKQSWSNGRVIEEISKCAVLCSCCHRLTHFEQGWGGSHAKKG